MGLKLRGRRSPHQDRVVGREPGREWRRYVRDPSERALVVNGEPAEPYEIPDSPALNEAGYRRIGEYIERQRVLRDTQFMRALRQVVEDVRMRKGPGFEFSLLGWVLEFHRVPTSDGVRLRLELWRGERQSLGMELWGRGNA